MDNDGSKSTTTTTTVVNTMNLETNTMNKSEGSGGY